MATPVFKHALLMLLAFNLVCLALCDRETGGSIGGVNRLESTLHMPSTISVATSVDGNRSHRLSEQATAAPNANLVLGTASQRIETNSPSGHSHQRDRSTASSSASSKTPTNEGLTEQSYREHLSSPLILNVDSSYDNSTFATYLCNQLNYTVTSLTLTAPSDHKYLLPSCVTAEAMNLNSVQLTNMIINNFANLPVVVSSMSFKTCFISSLTGSTTPSTEDGFNDDGTINWTEIFGRFSSLASFTTSSSFVSGTLPETLLSTIVVFNINGGDIYGSIPSTLLSSHVTQTSLYIELRNNRLMGALPAELMAPLETSTSMSTLSLDFDSNRIDGSIPSQFVRPGRILTLKISLANNLLRAELPNSLFKSALPLGSFTLDLSNNSLSGNLPLSIFNAGFASNTGNSLTLNLRSNSFTGPIPTGFLTGNLGSNLTLNSFTLDLSYNELSGTIPETLFSQTLLDKRSGVGSESGRSRDFSSIQSTVVSIGGSIGQLSLQHNGFEGTLPPSIMDYYLPYDGLTESNVLFSVSENSFTGSLPSVCSPTKTMSMNVALNQFSGTIPNEWASCKFSRIEISNNNIDGTIPPGLLNSSALTSFAASTTLLSGDLPNLSSSLNLEMSRTNLDLCSATSIASISATTLQFCSLQSTNTCGCESYYVRKCTITVCPPSPSTSPATPTGCQGPQPSPSFICIGGFWTAEVVTTPTLVIPANSGTIIVSGNMTSSSIVLNDLTSTIEVIGCATNLTQIHIELTKEQVEKLGKSQLYQLLSTLSRNCSTSLDDVNMSVHVRDGGCRKVSVRKVSSDDRSTLSGLFMVDNSSCKTWWIILISVVCGVIVLAILILVLLAIFYKPFRAKVRPYSKARPPGAEKL